MGMYKIKDLTFGLDCRGDYAFFIEDKHIDDFSFDDAVENVLPENDHPIFFRVIRNGKEMSGHGWIRNREIVQWG